MTKSSGQAGPPSDTHSVLGRRRAFIITDLVLRLLRERKKMEKNKKEAVLLINSLFSMVPVVGLEPTRSRPRRILNPLRLPFHHTGKLKRKYYNL